MVRKFKVKVNNKSYDVEVEELTSSASSTVQTPAPPKVEEVVTPQPVQKTTEQKKSTPPKPSVSAAEGEVVIESPMAGLIVDVLVSAGSQVKRGDVLLILEAMKMENNILSTKDGIVKSINVSKGQEVEVGAPLIVIE